MMTSIEIITAHVVHRYLLSEKLMATRDCFLSESNYMKCIRAQDEPEDIKALPALQEIILGFFGEPDSNEDTSISKVYALWKQLDVVQNQLRLMMLGRGMNRKYVANKKVVAMPSINVKDAVIMTNVGHTLTADDMRTGATIHSPAPALSDNFSPIITRQVHRQYRRSNPGNKGRKNGGLLRAGSASSVDSTFVPQDKITPGPSTQDKSLFTCAVPSSSPFLIHTPVVTPTKSYGDRLKSPRRKSSHPRRRSNVQDPTSSVGIPEAPSEGGVLQASQGIREGMAALIETLLSSEVLPEKLAENINKVVAVDGTVCSPDQTSELHDESSRIVSEVFKLASHDPDLESIFALLGDVEQTFPHFQDIHSALSEDLHIAEKINSEPCNGHPVDDVFTGEHGTFVTSDEVSTSDALSSHERLSTVGLAFELRHDIGPSHATDQSALPLSRVDATVRAADAVRAVPNWKADDPSEEERTFQHNLLAQNGASLGQSSARSSAALQELGAAALAPESLKGVHDLTPALEAPSGSVESVLPTVGSGWCHEYIQPVSDPGASGCESVKGKDVASDTGGGKRDGDFEDDNHAGSGNQEELSLLATSADRICAQAQADQQLIEPQIHRAVSTHLVTPSKVNLTSDDCLGFEAMLSEQAEGLKATCETTSRGDGSERSQIANALLLLSASPAKWSTDGMHFFQGHENASMENIQKMNVMSSLAPPACSVDNLVGACSKVESPVSFYKAVSAGPSSVGETAAFHAPNAFKAPAGFDLSSLRRETFFEQPIKNVVEEEIMRLKEKKNSRRRSQRSQEQALAGTNMKSQIPPKDVAGVRTRSLRVLLPKISSDVKSSQADMRVGSTLSVSVSSGRVAGGRDSLSSSVGRVSAEDHLAKVRSLPAVQAGSPGCSLLSQGIAREQSSTSDATSTGCCPRLKIADVAVCGIHARLMFPVTSFMAQACTYGAASTVSVTPTFTSATSVSSLVAPSLPASIGSVVHPGSPLTGAGPPASLSTAAPKPSEKTVVSKAINAEPSRPLTNATACTPSFLLGVSEAPASRVARVSNDSVKPSVVDRPTTKTGAIVALVNGASESRFTPKKSPEFDGDVTPESSQKQLVSPVSTTAVPPSRLDERCATYRPGSIVYTLTSETSFSTPTRASAHAATSKAFVSPASSALVSPDLRTIRLQSPSSQRPERSAKDCTLTTVSSGLPSSPGFVKVGINDSNCRAGKTIEEQDVESESRSSGSSEGIVTPEKDHAQSKSAKSRKHGSKNLLKVKFPSFSERSARQRGCRKKASEVLAVAGSSQSSISISLADFVSQSGQANCALENGSAVADHLAASLDQPLMSTLPGEGYGGSAVVGHLQQHQEPACVSANSLPVLAKAASRRSASLSCETKPCQVQLVDARTLGVHPCCPTEGTVSSVSISGDGKHVAIVTSDVVRSPMPSSHDYLPRAMPGPSGQSTDLPSRASLSSTLPEPSSQAAEMSSAVNLSLIVPDSSSRPANLPSGASLSCTVLDNRSQSSNISYGLIQPSVVPRPRIHLASLSPGVSVSCTVPDPGIRPGLSCNASLSPSGADPCIRAADLSSCSRLPTVAQEPSSQRAASSCGVTLASLAPGSRSRSAGMSPAASPSSAVPELGGRPVDMSCGGTVSSAVRDIYSKPVGSSSGVSPSCIAPEPVCCTVDSSCSLSMLSAVLKLCSRPADPSSGARLSTVSLASMPGRLRVPRVSCSLSLPTIVLDSGPARESTLSPHLNRSSARPASDDVAVSPVVLLAQSPVRATVSPMRVTSVLNGPYSVVSSPTLQSLATAAKDSSLVSNLCVKLTRHPLQRTDAAAMNSLGGLETVSDAPSTHQHVPVGSRNLEHSVRAQHGSVLSSVQLSALVEKNLNMAASAATSTSRPSKRRRESVDTDDIPNKARKAKKSKRSRRAKMSSRSEDADTFEDFDVDSLLSDIKYDL